MLSDLFQIISIKEISRVATTATIPLQSLKQWPSLKYTSIRDDEIRAGDQEELAGSGCDTSLGDPPKGSYCSGTPNASFSVSFI